MSRRPKPKPRKRKPFDRDRIEQIQKIARVLGAMLAIGIGLGFFYFLSLSGPRDVDPDDVSVSFELSPELLRLKAESLELEARFEEMLALREPAPEDIELLRQAAIKQQEFVDRIPVYDSSAIERNRGLRKRYHDFAAQPLERESLRYEDDARALERQDDYEAARTAYAQAHRLQRTINEQFPESAAVDHGRATRLQREGRRLSAEPLLRASKAHEAAAQQHVEAAEWEAAELELRAAIELQEQINREYRGTNQASILRREQLQTRLIAVRTGSDHLEIESLKRLAMERQAAGDYLEAASLYQEAKRLQEELNRDHPDSPHASADAVALLERKRQTAQSYELGLDIERSSDRLGELLAQRKAYEAGALTVELRDKMQQMNEVYPRSALNNEELMLKIQYLNLIQGDLEFIQERIYGALLDIPEVEAWKMMRTEVSQALFELIMGVNPSRNRGDLLPVETVSWYEAKEFCTRISWILGKPVRLPTEHEFRTSVGRLRYVRLEDHAWTADDSEGTTQAVATKAALASGYHDLLGNVSEWLESIDRLDSESALLIGGNAQDSLDVIFTVPVRSLERAERNRMTGFRIVVRVDGAEK